MKAFITAGTPFVNNCAMPTTFVVHGAHVTENLLHHKASDVRRILEEKGFAEKQQDADGDTRHFYPATGVEGATQTTVRFDDQDFVLEKGGVDLAG